MSVAMSPVISESCEYKQNVAESTVDAGNPPRYPSNISKSIVQARILMKLGLNGVLSFLI